MDAMHSILLDGRLSSQGSGLTYTAHTGSIRVTKDSLFSGSTAKLDAGKDIIVGGSLAGQNSVLTMTARAGNIQVAGDADFTGGTVHMDAMQSILLGGRLSSQGTGMTLTAHTDSIQVAKDSLFNGSTAKLDVGKDITVGGSLAGQNSVLTMTARAGNIQVAGDADFTGGTVNMDAMQSILLGGRLSSQGAGLTYTAHTGSIQVVKNTIFGGSTVMLNAGRDIKLMNRLTAAASVMNMSASAGSIDILDRTVLTDASRLVLKAAQNIASGEICLNASQLTADAGIHILTDTIESSDSNLALLAGGNIALKNEHSYIYYRDNDKAADERLTLKAGGNIGSADRPILLDMAETLYIQAAMDYFIRAEVLVPDPNLNPGDDVLFRRVIGQDIIHSGYDDDGNFVSGDYLGDGNPLTEQINAALAIQTNEEIAQWLAGRIDRLQAVSILTKDALVRLITSGALTKTALVALLAGDNRNVKKQVNAIFEQPNAAQTLADMLLGKMADKVNGAYTMDNGQLAQIFKGAMGGGELKPVGLIAGLLNQYEVDALLNKAWKLADYADRNAPDNLEARPLNIEVEEAFGAAFVTNEGDIHIIQKYGTLTAGAIASERNDVTLTALNGSIMGNFDGQTDIIGREITLTAHDHVTGLVIDQRYNTPALTANIIKPVKGANGYENLTIIQAVATDADGNIMYDGIATMVLDLRGKPVLDQYGYPAYTGLVEYAMDSQGRMMFDRATGYPVVLRVIGNPLVQWMLVTELRYEWLRVTKPQTATRMTVTAGGNMDITEADGDMGLAGVSTAGDVKLKAPGSILDVRESNESGILIKTAGNLVLISENGTIGQDGKYITTKVDGATYASAKGNISIAEEDDLNLTADSQKGQVNASAKGNLYLTNTLGDLKIGPIIAAGIANIESAGGLYAGDRLGHAAQITAGGIQITAHQGNVGTDGSLLLIDTQKGTFSAAVSGSLYIAEISGDLTIDHVNAGGTVQLTAPGTIADTGSGNAMSTVSQAAISLKQAQAIAQGKYAAAQLLMAQAEKAAEKAQKALEVLWAAQDALSRKPDDKRLASAVAKAQLLYDARFAEAQYAKEMYQAALQAYSLAYQDVEAAQMNYDEAMALTRQPSIISGGDMILTGSSIGNIGSPLTVSAGGVVTITGKDRILLDSKGNLTLYRAEAEDIEIDSLGSITGAAYRRGDNITGNTLVIRSFGGDVGENTRYIRTMVHELTAMGRNIYIRNGQDLIIHQIAALQETGATAKIKVSGAVFAGSTSGGLQHMYADSLVLWSGKNVGMKNDPLNVILGYGGTFSLHINAGRGYYITGAEPRITWENVLPWIIDNLPEPYEISPDTNGNAYTGQYGQLLDTIRDIRGSLGSTILSAYPMLSQKRIDKVEQLYTALQSMLNPGSLRLLNFNTGTILTLDKSYLNTRLMVDMIAKEDLPTLGGQTALYAVKVWLRNEANENVDAAGKMTLTFRLPDAIGKTVTVWHREADGQWTKILTTMNLTGEITVEVDSLGAFAFTLGQAAL